MLIDFKVKNYRSIKDEQDLSMLSTKQKEHIDTHTFKSNSATKINLLKTAAIYGANAAGKSNFIKALKTMQEVVINSMSTYQRGHLLPIKPFLFDVETKNEPTEFEVNFITNNVRYQYGFSATQERIVEEWLIAYPKGRPQNWFARVLNTQTDTPSYDWQFGEKFTGQKQLWQESTRDNALFLSTAIYLNSEQLKPVYDWFDKTLKITGVGGWTPKSTIELCKQDKHKNSILQFLQTADMDIDDIIIDENITKSKDSEGLGKGLAALLIEIDEAYSDVDTSMVTMMHKDNSGKRVPLKLEEESDGTQKLFAFIGPWLDSLENGHVLLIDELHDNFHPLMVKFLVDLFHNNLTNKSNAQLIFTTHETSILSQDVFRRDQIWFCEKKNKATELYSLVEFKARKGVTDLEKAYLSGRYGALPYFKNITLEMGEV